MTLREYNSISDSKFIKTKNNKILPITQISNTAEFEDILIGTRIAEGGFSNVYEITNMPNYILKRIFIARDTLYMDEDFIKEVNNQIKAAKYNLASPILLYYKQKENHEAGIIMEKYEKTLMDILNDNNVIIERKKKYLDEIKILLNKLYKEAELIHDDSQLHNFMLDKEGKIKLIDFGFSFSKKKYYSSQIKEEKEKLIDIKTFKKSLERSLKDENVKNELIQYWENN